MYYIHVCVCVCVYIYIYIYIYKYILYKPAQNPILIIKAPAL